MKLLHHMAIGLLLSSLAILATAAYVPAHADQMIDGAKRCTQFIPHHERQYGIPSHLLSAISSTESGRWHQGLRIVLPWPWTINVEGKGYYFNSKQEAIAAVTKYKAQGIKSIDIGCMQVNLLHHPNAFSNLDEAFEPKTNIAYAASFLRNLYESEGSWRKAAAAYHSKTVERGSLYVGRVFRSWETIIQRLRLPRDAVMQADAGFDGKTIALQAAAESSPHTKVPAATLSEQSGRKLAQQKPVQMKVIKVSNDRPARENGIIMIRPDVSTEDLNAVSAAPIVIAQADTASPQASASNAHVVRLDGGSGTQNVSFNTGTGGKTRTKGQAAPRFIFTD